MREPSNELIYDEGDDNSHKSADQQKDRFLIVSLALFSCLFNAVEFLAVIGCDNLFIGINVIAFLRLFDFQCIEQRSAYDDPPRSACRLLPDTSSGAQQTGCTTRQVRQRSSYPF